MRHFGVPSAGAFDRGAHALANALVGNLSDAATLEMTLFGGTYEALCPILAAWAGAEMEVRVERADGSFGGSLPAQSVQLGTGDRLVFHRCLTQARCYLAVTNGFQSERVLGSCSSEAPLRAGDTLSGSPSRGATSWPAAELAARFWSRDAIGDAAGICTSVLRVVSGPDATTSSSVAGPREFRVGSASNRMGIRLESLDLAPAGTRQDSNRLSAPVAPGAVQETPAGLIILGVASGTMGGYPHVAHVISADFDQVAQLRPGVSVAFEEVSLDEARRLDALQTAERRHAGLIVRTAVASWTRAPDERRS
jgi:antagonist of KipI